MKKIVIVIIILSILFIGTTYVSASSKVSARIEVNKEEIRPNEEILVELKLENYQNIDKGINAYKATLEYDETIFEEVTHSDFTCLNDWSNLEYNPNNKEFIAIKKAGSIQDESVVTIRLKVKENASYGYSIIKISNLEVSEGEADIQVNSSEKQIQIIQKAENISEDGVETENQDELNENNQEDNENDSSNQIQEEYLTKLPYTGKLINSTQILVIIGLLIVIAIYFYMKSKSIKSRLKKNEKIFLFIVLTIVFFAGFFGPIYAAFISKGELNGDGNINDMDINLLQLHLIKSKSIVEDKLENADINDDKEITITDLTLLIQKIEDTLEYAVELMDVELENYYPIKNQNISLTFLGEVLYDAEIKKVVINNNEYNVEKVANVASTYTVNVNSGEEAGIKEYHFTEVTLDNNKKVKVDYTVKVDVLKDKPQIENYEVQEDINNSKLNISFNLLDIDDALTEARYEITDESLNNIEEGSLNKGLNNIEVNVEEEKKYYFNIYVRYNLDSDILETETDNTGIVQEENELELVIDYNFKISDIKTYNEDTENNIFEKNQKIKLKFNSSNSTNFEPAKIFVNNKEYDVIKNGTIYEVEIDGFLEFGNNELNIEKIILNNGKAFEIEDIQLSVEIIKREPIVEDFETEENTEQSKLSVKFTLQDEDNSIIEAKIILLDSNGIEIGNKEITGNSIFEEFNTTITKNYTVKVIVTYNLSEDETSQNYTDKVIFEEQISAKARAEITEVSTSKLYPTKNEEITLTYKVETNKDEYIERIVVNSIEYIATRVQDEEYKITINVDSENGIKNLITTKVIFTDNTEANVDNTIKIDILKDKPYVEDYHIEDDIDNNEVIITFNLNDPDNSFINGKAYLVKKEDSTSKIEKEIQLGYNTIKFEVEELELYKFNIIISYDLDTNSLENGEEEKNKVENEEIFAENVQQVIDYELTIKEIQTYKNNNISKYFEKTESIILQFTSTNVTNFYPQKAVINGNEYELEKTDNTYKAVVTGFEDAGVQNLKIEKIILNNQKELEVEDKQISIDVLKEVPSVNNFEYQETEDNKVQVSLEIVDSDNAIVSGKIIVIDEFENEVCNVNSIIGNNEISFDKESSEKFIIKLIVDYDLDSDNSNSDNEIKDETLLAKEIDISNRLYQIKDIETISLYNQSGNKVDQINIEDIEDLKNYVVKVEMKDMPVLYSEIREYKIENETLKFILDQEKIVEYEEETKTTDITFEFGKITNNIAYTNTLENLIKEIEENPSGTFELTADLDASNFTIGSSILDETKTFSGTINGNGYTIYNLSIPLFNDINGATIENLIIEDAKFSTVGRGIIANEASNITLNNVHIVNPKIIVNTADTGVFIGIINNSSIEQCSVSGMEISATSIEKIGGFVGNAVNSTINNSYVEGTMTSNVNYVGGFAGYGEYLTISNSYSNVQFELTGSGTLANGGFIGHCNPSSLINCLSVGSGTKTSHFIGRVQTTGTYTNNYALNTTLGGDTRFVKPETIEEEDLYNLDLFEDDLEWDLDIWDCSKLEQGVMPTLNNSDPNNKEEESEIYIPDYTRLEAMSNYDTNKEIAYHNIYKLMPFYDAKYLVIDGNKIEEDNILNTQIIKSIIPFDEDGNAIWYLTDSKTQQIAKIKVLFEDNTLKEYTVEFSSYTNNIAEYKIEELNIIYQYSNYVIKEDTSVVTDLVNMIKEFDYATDLDILTTEEDSRLYEDYFNETTKLNIGEWIYKLLQNEDNYNVYIQNEALYNKIKNELEEDKLKEIVYAYNYYSRWYDINIENIDIVDLLLWNGELFNSNMTFSNMVDEVLNISSNRTTNNTHTFYANQIAKYTNYSDIGQFLDYLITTFGDYEVVDDWLTENYKGIVYEIDIEGKPEYEYRAYTKLKYRINMLLPFLTLPENSAYIISSPTQFLVGSQRTYISDPTDETQREELMQKITDYSELIESFYTTASGWISSEIMNLYADVQIDRRYIKNTDGTTEIPESGITEEAFHKNFNEALGLWASQNGSAAYATGETVYWVAYRALDSFSTWSHESGHNQDSKIFLKGNGRRQSGWAEDYADGNTTQSFNDGAVNFNLTYDYDFDSEITTNLTTERIDTIDEINSYYKEMFKANDFLDYVEAKAFLELTPEEQSKVAVQVYYLDNDGNEIETGEITGWRVLSAEDFEEMNLQTIEDIWDNKITIKPGVTSDTTIGTNKYGGEGIYVRHWYQPHNDNGRPDSYSLKWLAWEMLGYAGYDDGYITYYSGNYKTDSTKSVTDLAAIQTITGDSSMTWKQYKLSRYSYMEDMWSKMENVDADELLNQYIEALKTDARNEDRNVTVSTNVKRINYHYLKRITNDFESDIFSEVSEIHISNATEFVEQITRKSIRNFCVR